MLNILGGECSKNGVADVGMWHQGVPGDIGGSGLVPVWSAVSLLIVSWRGASGRADGSGRLGTARDGLGPLGTA